MAGPKLKLIGDGHHLFSVVNSVLVAAWHEGVGGPLNEEWLITECERKHQHAMNKGRRLHYCERKQDEEGRKRKEAGS